MMIKRLKVLMIKTFLIVVGYLPANPKLIIFESFGGKQYSCNPKAIYEYMLNHHPDYHMYWSVDKHYRKHFEGENLSYVTRYTLKWLIMLGFSKYWISNSRMPTKISKPKHTIYIQTWHGTPLKKLVFDMKEVYMPNVTTKQYKADFYQESRNWDYLLSPNAYSTDIFKSAFRFEKKMIECGYPRNDILCNGNDIFYINKLKKMLNIPLGKKVILYAPTWRDNQYEKVGHYKFELPLNLTELQKKYGKDYVIILRMHYFVIENFDLSPYENFVYDFSQNIDINTLYLISDLLITDYSSVFFDYALLKRPIIFYMYDFELYRDTLRGFYFDIEKEAPGPIVKNMQHLIEAIETFHQNGKFVESERKYEKFRQKFCYLENGDSTRQVVQNVILGVD